MQNLKLRLKLGWCWKICRARLAKMIDGDSIYLWNFTACIYSYRNMSWIDILLNVWTIYRYACNLRDVVISWLLRCVTDGSWGVDGVRMGRWATETAGPRATGHGQRCTGACRLKTRTREVVLGVRYWESVREMSTVFWRNDQDYGARF